MVGPKWGPKIGWPRWLAQNGESKRLVRMVGPKWQTKMAGQNGWANVGSQNVSPECGERTWPARMAGVPPSAKIMVWCDNEPSDKPSLSIVVSMNGETAGDLLESTWLRC